jgi:hypothetical protein
MIWWYPNLKYILEKIVIPVDFSSNSFTKRIGDLSLMVS